METEAEIRVMLPQTKNIWSYLEPRSSMEVSPLEPSEGAWPCQHLDLGLLASRTVRE